MPAIGRNDPCRCGSGKRYKACCGQLAATESSRDVAATMKAALAAQQARRLDQAERLYRAALAVDPDLADALHMLGVVCYEQGNDAEAWRLILRALDVTDWRYPAYRHNFGLVLARAWRHLDAAKVAAARGRYRQLGALRSAPPRSLSPRVAVVVPSFNHAGFVEHALDSVF